MTAADQAIDERHVDKYRQDEAFRKYIWEVNPEYAKAVRNLADAAYAAECKLANRYLADPDSREEILRENPTAAARGQRMIEAEENKKRRRAQFEAEEARMQMRAPVAVVPSREPAPAPSGGKPRPPHQLVDQNAHLRKIMDSRKLKEMPHALLCALVLHHVMGRRHKKNFGAATPFANSLMMQETGLSERQVQYSMKFLVKEVKLYERVDGGKGGRGAKGKTAATYVPAVPTWW